MPPPAALPEYLAEDALRDFIRQAYEKAELEVLEIVRRRLERGIDTPGWAEHKLAEIRALRRELGVPIGKLADLSPEIQKAIDGAYAEGAADAGDRLIRAGLTNFDINPLASKQSLKLLAQDAIGALGKTHTRILRQSVDVYRSAVADASAQVLIGTATHIEAVQQVLDAWANSGISGFVDSAGRHWTLEAYAQMAVGQSARNANVAGKLAKYEANDIDLIVVPDTPEECPKCSPWENKVLSRSGKTEGYPSLENAKGEGLLHVGCNHTQFGPFIPGVTEIPPPKTKKQLAEAEKVYEQRQKQRQIERHIRKWKRREVAAMDPVKKKQARAKVRQWQATLREFAAETGRDVS